VTVHPNPFVFFVDPEVAYNQIRLQATLYLAGLNGPSLDFVGIRRTGSGDPYTSLTFTFDPARPNQALVLIPQGLTPGDYDILIRDGKTCESTLPQGLKITNTTTLLVKSIDPPFGWTQQETPVTLRSEDPPPAGRVNFQNGVRVYLSPSSGTGLASAMKAVAFVSPDEVNAVVPKLPVGQYDVIAVNPDGTVGVLQQGFLVTQLSPPLIASISPGSIPNSTTQSVRLRGEGFRAGATVTLECRAPNGAITTRTTTVTNLQANEITISIASGILAGSLCIIIVTNTDGTFAEFSALGVTNPAENIGAPSLVTEQMTVGRRALASVAGRPTLASRFLYAIGGDNGNTTGALASVEAAPINRFGDVGAWRVLSRPLPVGITLASAQRIGRFVYLVGGHSNGEARNHVYRAEILEPRRVPQFDEELSFTPDDNNGLAVGLWYYRVSAVMGASDPYNPSGETLPSEPLPIKIPPNLAKKIQLTLRWSPIAGAIRYRIYRTPTPGLIAGQERLLAEVNAPTTEYKDIGGTTGTDIPRKLGDLGEWATLPSLSVAREGLGLGLAPDPVDAARWYLYALGGRQNATTLNSTYEYLSVTVDADGGHSIGTSWQGDAPNPMPAGRWQMAAFSVDDVATIRYAANEVWIFAGPGSNATGGMVNRVDAAKVSAGGRLESWINVDSPTGQGWAGYGYAAAANQLFLFGGQGGSPSNSVISAQLCGIGFSCPAGPPDPPDLQNWNAAGISLATPRFLMASVIESGRIFLLGGAGTSGVLRSVESTVW
jgi:hypothetical protein